MPFTYLKLQATTFCSVYSAVKSRLPDRTRMVWVFIEILHIGVEKSYKLENSLDIKTLKTVFL